LNPTEAWRDIAVAKEPNQSGRDSMNASPKSPRDYLTTTTDDGKIELTEAELSRVSGGVKCEYWCQVVRSLPDMAEPTAR
jgi:hypothetical protein